MLDSARSRHMLVALAAGSALLATAATALVATWPRTLLESLPATWRIWLSALRHGIDVDHDVRILMSDGTRLSASLYLPRRADRPMPTILVRLPYHRLRYGEGYGSGLFFARNGYAVLVVDVRGTGDSEGELLPWAHAAEDAVDLVAWIEKQPWSDGKVGTYGCSALGETQLVSQDRAPPQWRAMIASGAGGAVGSLAGRHGYFGVFEGGIFQLASGFGWFVESGSVRPDAPRAIAFDPLRVLRMLPVAGLVEQVRPSPNGYSHFLTTPLGDRRWSELGYLDDSTRLKVPALIINTWGDQTLQETLALSEHWRRSDPEKARAAQKVIIAPGPHCNHEEAGHAGRFGELEIGDAALPYREIHLRWFAHWLRGHTDALEEFPAYTYYVVGADRWLRSDSWPPTEARPTRWYLGSEGRANTRNGNGSLGKDATAGAKIDTWRYDPARPVPTRGGPICCTGDPEDRSGPADQSDVEVREDVLVYTSAPLQEELWIAGPIKADIVVSSDRLDTDIVARLVHVRPDGRATSIQEGGLRLRYRNGFEAPRLLDPGEPVRVTVGLRSIAYRMPMGHRLRLQLTSSSFPRLERNLNTGEDNASGTRMLVATNSIHYDVGAGSWLELMVLPRH